MLAVAVPVRIGLVVLPALAATSNGCHVTLALVTWMIGRNAARALSTAASATMTFWSEIAARSLRVAASWTACSSVSPTTGGGSPASAWRIAASKAAPAAMPATVA